MTNSRLFPVAVLLAACGGTALPSATSDGDSTPATATVTSAQHHDVSPPLFLMPPAERQAPVEHEVKSIPRHFNLDGASRPDPVRQTAYAPLAAPTLLGGFDGVGNGFTGPSGTFTVNSAPPDTVGDVGPNHYVQVVNTDYAVFSKTGAALFGPVPTNSLWSGFGGNCQTRNDGDAIVLYDPISDRWLVSQFSVPTGGPYEQCVAVSTTGDPTGSYARYSFSSASGFNDYPKFGVWPDAYYVSYNIFGGRRGNTFAGATICAFDRAKMLTGAAATQQCFNLGTSFGGVLPADLDGKTLPPAGEPEWFIGLGATVGNTLAYWKFHVDWTTPSNTTLTPAANITVSTFSEACNGGTCIPQAGTSQQLDSLADRVMFRFAYRNFGSHEALVVNHSVTAGASTGVRWYELRPAGGALTLFQEGTYAPDSLYRWMGSAAQDSAGNMALGFSVSSSGTKPAIHYTARLAGDPAGTMTQGEGTLIDGTGSQLSNLNRWGDYSMLGVDPVDDCTFWFTSEYLKSDGTFNWSTRIGSFKLPGCGTPPPPPGNDFSISANPSSVSAQQGASATSTIATAVLSGTAETVTFSATGLPAGATASFNPASVTAGGGSTLTIATATTTPAGTYAITVTGTATSATHSTTVTLTVTGITPPPSPDFSLAVSPASRSIKAGLAVSYAVTVTPTNGFTGSVALSASGGPAGATFSFSPNPTSTSSTLTVQTVAGRLGTNTITVTGTSGTLSHSATASLTTTKH